MGGSITITSVSGTSPNWILTVHSSEGVSPDDYIAAKYEGAPAYDGGIYRVDTVPDATHVNVVDDVRASVYGSPEVGEAYYCTPTEHVRLSQLPHRSRFWGSALTLDKQLIDEAIGAGGGGGGGSTQGTVLGSVTELFSLEIGDDLTIETDEGESGTFVVQGTGASILTPPQPEAVGYTKVLGSASELFDGISAFFGPQGLPYNWVSDIPEDYDTSGWAYGPGDSLITIFVGPTEVASYVGDGTAPPAAPASTADVVSWLNARLDISDPEYSFSWIDDAGVVAFRFTVAPDTAIGNTPLASEGVSDVAATLGFVPPPASTTAFIGKVLAVIEVAPESFTLRNSGSEVPPDPASATEVATWLNNGSWDSDPIGVTFETSGGLGDKVDIKLTGDPGQTLQNMGSGLSTLLGWDTDLHTIAGGADGWNFPSETRYSVLDGGVTEVAIISAGKQTNTDLAAIFDALSNVGATANIDGSVTLTSLATGYAAHLYVERTLGPGPDNGAFLEGYLDTDYYGSGTVDDIDAATALGVAKGLSGSFQRIGVESLGRMHGTIPSGDSGKLRLTRELPGASRWIQVTGGTLQAKLGLDGSKHYGT